MGRRLVSTLADLHVQDGQDEIVDGYRDARAGEPEPGENRSYGYWHGYQAGLADRTKIIPPELRALAREIVQGVPK